MAQPTNGTPTGGGGSTSGLSTGVVRPAELRDIPTIKFVAHTSGMFPPDILDDMITGYLSKKNADIWVVHEDTSNNSSSVTGFAFCEPDRMADGAVWNLVALGVDPSQQRKGVASKIVAFIEKKLTKQKGRLLLVETSTADDFHRTSSFLTKVGFKEEARIREYYEAGIDKVIFWRKLQAETQA